MGGTSKTVQENKPPKWAEGLFSQSADVASDLFNSGSGGNPYMGSAVADLSGTTMQGVNQLANAGQNWDTSGTRDLFGQIGAAAASNPFVSQLQGLAGGIQGGTTNTSGIQGGQTDVSGINANNVSAADYRGILDRAQQPTAASQYLQDYASGAYLNGEGNPFYRQNLERDLDSTAAQVQSLMAGAGRTGSGVHVGTLTDALSGQRLQALENDWNREQANQFNAVGMLDAANQGALASQLGAAGGIAGINTGNADRALQAGISRAGFSAGDLDRALQAGTARAGFQQADLDRGLSAAGLQGNLLGQAGDMYSSGLGQAQTAAQSMAGLDQQNFENRLAGAGATLQAGQLLDNQAQQQLSDEVRRFYEADNADWTRLGMLQAAAAGAAGPYGTQIATQRTNPGLGSILGLMGGK